MEGGEASAATATPSKARRGRGVSIYDKYLNIKNNALNGEHGPSDKKSMEISNSTDEQELEAGEVVSTEENDAACANGPSGLGVSAAPVDGKRELEVEPQAQTQPQPQQVTADTPQPEVPADSAPVAEGNTALTAAATVDASTAAAPMSPSTAAFERARAPALSNPSSPSRSPPNDQYAAMRVGDPVKMINNGREMTSPRMGGPDGRNGNGDMNGGHRHLEARLGMDSLMALQEIMPILMGRLEAPTVRVVVLVADQEVLHVMVLVEGLVALAVALMDDLVVHRMETLMDDLVVHRAENLMDDLVARHAVDTIDGQVVRLVVALMDDPPAHRVMVSVVDAAAHLVIVLAEGAVVPDAMDTMTLQVMMALVDALHPATTFDVHP
ncbi:LOW QUALITY PROTEIN: hypothetical protein PHMEG_000414 [Phytophthora megakarya]|uniref:Uncharacterized protein n=1 Tax=Phytophthora megakarya TaxID=4795 RepID=A0A225X345_9STRA|nr:LOW QUALITY PROTEIN: hypothetical protein PHMEG_000414 [Phytophthora megakarya]